MTDEMIATNEQIASSIEKCDWSGCSIGNKMLLRLAVQRLRESVKVKALDWVEIPSCNGMSTAKTAFGTYYIGASNIVRYGLKTISKPYATRAEAKAAAQADYEARILSSLENNTCPTGGNDEK